MKKSVSTRNEVLVDAMRLGFERLAHGAKDVDLASGQAGSVGGLASHGSVRCCWIVF